MNTIYTNYIDLRDEHRVYLLPNCGILSELAGMIAFTDYNKEVPSIIPGLKAPQTKYKLIFDSIYMDNGGIYPESELPHPFARRGSTIKIGALIELFLKGIIYEVCSPIEQLVDIDSFGIKVKFPENKNAISLCLDEIEPNHYDIENNLGCNSLFIEFLKQKRRRVNLIFDGVGLILSIKRLAEVCGKIIYALRSYFNNNKIGITDISIVKETYTDKLPTETPAPASFQKFLRLVRLATEKEAKYFKNKSYSSKE